MTRRGLSKVAGGVACVTSGGERGGRECTGQERASSRPVASREAETPGVLGTAQSRPHTDPGPSPRGTGRRATRLGLQSQGAPCCLQRAEGDAAGPGAGSGWTVKGSQPCCWHGGGGQQGLAPTPGACARQQRGARGRRPQVLASGTQADRTGRGGGRPAGVTQGSAPSGRLTTVSGAKAALRTKYVKILAAKASEARQN